MSHFVVLAFLPAEAAEDIEGALEDALAPYSEDLEVEPYVDQTADEVKKEMVEQVLPYYVKEGTDTVGMTTAQLWKDWSGKDLDAEGNSLSTFNPDAQWDWYQIGGRWAGALLLKPGATGAPGDPSWTREGESAEQIYGNGRRCDVARVQDVDWAAMDAAAKQNAGERWDRVVERGEPAWAVNGKELIETYGTREAYVAAASWSPYAVLDQDGEWHAPGKMGWFGMSSESADEAQAFESSFYERFVKDAEENTIVVVVDCHV